jgi:hypothetical protein
MKSDTIPATPPEPPAEGAETPPAGQGHGGHPTGFVGGRNLPPLAAACLSFHRATALAACKQAAALDGASHRRLLAYTDRSGLTLHVWRALRGAGLASQTPFCQDYEERVRKNCVRLERRRGEIAELLALFHAAGLRVAVLKGVTLEPDFVSDACDRVQYDLDFYLSEEHARSAYELLVAWGHEPLTAAEGPTDHLPALARKTGWEWRGDFFDVDIPAAIELHFRLWDSVFECIPLGFDPEPLARLVDRNGIPSLELSDQLAGCALHMLRHLFRGSLRLSHLYEIAQFLENHAEDRGFWHDWRASPNIPLRRLCAAAFGLAVRVFHCRLAPEAQPEMQLVPCGARAWLEKFSGDAVQPGHRRKEEALLQLSFVAGWRDGLRVLRRRLLPLSIPGPIDAVYLPAGTLSPGRRLLRAGRQGAFMVSRALYHARALFGFPWAALSWLISSRWGPDPGATPASQIRDPD